MDEDQVFVVETRTRAMLIPTNANNRTERIDNLCPHTHHIAMMNRPMAGAHAFMARHVIKWIVIPVHGFQSEREEQ